MRRKIVNMKSNAKARIIILLTLGIVFGLSLFITANLNSNVGISNKFSDDSDDNNLNNENLKISAVSGKIHIINNSGWVAFRSDGNCTGNGTYSEPYVIEDLVIDGGGSGDCIYIENSNVYFRIKNCTTYNSGFNWTGIKLKSVSNGTLYNNTASNDNQHGIHLDGSNINNITENYANNNLYAGINLQDSDRNNISGNIVVNNSANGINLVNSRNNDITENEVQCNTEYGINLQGSNSNNISGNNVLNNGVGIYLDDSSYNIITGNAINYNIGTGILSYGDYFTKSCDNMISGNIINNNGGSGIHLWYSYWNKGSSNTISGNTINNNDGSGISLDDCDNNWVSGNIINNNSGSGIYLIESRDNGVLGNIINNNRNVGICVLGGDYEDQYYTYRSYNSITGNMVNNSNIGISLSNSYSNDVAGNTVNNSKIGIYFFKSHSNDVEGNTVNNSNIGIKIVDSKRNYITENEVHHNTEYGIFLEKSDYNTIQMNTITRSSVGIYLFYSYQNSISSNTFSGNGVDIKDVIIELILWIVIIIVIFVAVIATLIVGRKIRKKSKPNKLKLPKDEVVRYEITQELERQGKSVSDQENYDKIEWRYCKTCKKIVEPIPTKGLLKAKRKLVRRGRLEAPKFLIQAGNQACPHCSKRLIPKELRRYRYYCIFAICFWVILASIVFPASMIMHIPESFAEIVAGISFLGLLIGFSIYSKLILGPRLKKKMQLGESEK